jgi:hypothetical protein
MISIYDRIGVGGAPFGVAAASTIAIACVFLTDNFVVPCISGSSYANL